MIDDLEIMQADSDAYIVATYWKGHNEGRAEGRDKERQRAIKQMLINGVSKDIILQTYLISESELESLSTSE